MHITNQQRNIYRPVVMAHIHICRLTGVLARAIGEIRDRSDVFCLNINYHLFPRYGNTVTVEVAHICSSKI